MSMSEDRERYVEGGDTALYDRWPPEVFLKNVRAFCDRLERRLKNGEDVEPRIWDGRKANGKRSKWLYIASRGLSEEAAAKEMRDCEEPDCFDLSDPCPPC